MERKNKMRAREAGLRLEGTPALLNSITDVRGVEVGYATKIVGKPEDAEAGRPFARTGVTAILPRGRTRSAVYAGRHDMNGNGELTGTHWIDDSGFMHGPLMITNTNSVGVVRDTVSKWMVENDYYYHYYYDGAEIPACGYFYPTVGETWDGLLNDINGFHIDAEDVLCALNDARSGAIREGNVGGGTGMVCHDFKGGTGTSSRVVSTRAGEYTLGVLVQANHGIRPYFRIGGVPVGKLLTGYSPKFNTLRPAPGTGSIIVVIATDAPLLPHQLTKLCKRVPIGIGLLGSGYENDSGDIFLAFSTANQDAFTYTKTDIEILGDDQMDPLYKATAEAVEESILNALFAAESMTGMGGNYVPALPQREVMSLLEGYGRSPE
ncbi:MAG: P1 family peptidase [Clostridiales Family XIII bacterium]|jgi:L-aminopeptidase/D-esterase-like protein|nr:P1 family peptidase [Clostridiales Family XIII bacterium]